MGIKENIEELLIEIKECAERNGRTLQDIHVIGVSKTFSKEHVREAYEGGLRIFGENKVQEAEEKISQLHDLPDIVWHLVGHLQTNKAKKAVNLFSMIQSIDKFKTLNRVNEYAKERGIVQDVLIEVNTSNEESKFGIHPDNLNALLEQTVSFDNVRIKGLMTIGPFTEDNDKIRCSFSLLKELYEEMKIKYSQIPFEYLSMGMTDDFSIAIECGSNMVRIGRRIFGQRSYL